MVDLQQVLNSSLSLRLVSALARKLPPPAGYRIASRLADYVARRRDSQVVRALRLNQWVAHGESLDVSDLDQAVRETLQYFARCIFDLYHYVEDPEAAAKLIVLESSFQQIFRRPEFDQRGLVIIGLHMSNFDLVLQWVCRRGMRPLALTIPDPQGARRMEFEMRKQTGITLLPASVSAFRHTLKHLQKGGMVLTGIDRPISRPAVCPRFFGHPAALPVHSTFLASKACVPLVIAVTQLHDDGKYHVFASDPLEMEPHPDPEVALLRNAEHVLRVAEGFIRQAPRQWSVPLPVWPQLMDLVPG
jgi:phosphatidylinositol dimannoside acyltransferase